MILFAGRVLPAGAQSYEDLLQRTPHSRLLVEGLALPGTRGKSLAIVTFRIPNDQLVFTRRPVTGGEKALMADVDVTVQLMQRRQIVREKTWQGKQVADRYEDTSRNDADIQGSVFFLLDPGAYSYRIRVAGQSPTQEWSAGSIIVPSFAGTNVGRGFVATAVRDGPDPALELAALGGSLPYGEDARVLIPLSIDPQLNRPDSITWKLYRIQSPERHVPVQSLSVRVDDLPDETAEIQETVAPGRPEVLVRKGRIDPDSMISMGMIDSTGIRDRFIRWGLDHGVGTAFLVDLPWEGKIMADGSYLVDLSVASGSDVISRQTRLDTYWRNMPVSLNHVNAAISNLSFIESRDKVRELLKGSEREREINLRAYWHQKDPTPGTEYNELMAEYYARIDFAANEYATGSYAFPDGHKTDRGRVYIVYGPPDSVKRSLPVAGGVLETWTYAGGKTFVFQAESSLDPFVLQNP